jgi:hypothetical protein
MESGGIAQGALRGERAQVSSLPLAAEIGSASVPTISGVRNELNPAATACDELSRVEDRPTGFIVLTSSGSRDRF